MKDFNISAKLNPNKVFILKKNELEKRLDPFYYVPSIVALENKVLAKKPKRLRDYVLSIASGATPKTTESDKYYSDVENGIPFLRVQNLSPTGILEFEDCKFINKETHEGMLKRSQVFGNNLLVKITGVGRMAVASVASEEFEGNINQHLVCIKTGSKEISETIAAFLNSDIGEALASRRSTGGTRPALDYPALLSIPIIYDTRILEVTNKVVKQKKQNETRAQNLLKSISHVILEELEIDLPKSLENSLRERMFTSSLRQITGDRFDPIWQSYIRTFGKLKYPTVKLKMLLLSDPQYGANEIGIERNTSNEPRYIRITDINEYGELNPSLGMTANCIEEKYFLHDKDILIARSGNTVGKSYIHKETKVDHQCFFAGYMIRFRIDENKACPDYVFEFTQCEMYKRWAQAVQRITGQPNINSEEYKSLEIPLPLKELQLEIVKKISVIRNEAKELQLKTEMLLKQASEEIEQLILSS